MHPLGASGKVPDAPIGCNQLIDHDRTLTDGESASTMVGQRTIPEMQGADGDRDNHVDTYICIE
jgi:hypothetical protein